MEQFIEAIEKSLVERNWLAALTIALTLPDICGSTESPRASNGERYRKWCDIYLCPRYRHVLGGSPDPVEFLSPGDLWKLRNAVVHEGASDRLCSEEIAEVLHHVQFSIGRAHCSRYTVNDVAYLNLAVPNFCGDVINGVRAWCADVAANDEIQERLKLKLVVHTTSYQIAPGVEVGVWET